MGSMILCLFVMLVCRYECPSPVVDCIEVSQLCLSNVGLCRLISQHLQYLLEFGLLEVGLFRVPGEAKKIKQFRSHSAFFAITCAIENSTRIC